MSLIDQGMSEVMEFHLTFDCPVHTWPCVPKLSLEAGRGELLNLASDLRWMARKLKDRAAQHGIFKNTTMRDLMVRFQLIVEETGELAEALAEGDRVKVLHELSDLGYVVDGTYLTLGLAGLKRSARAEVHKANMSKLGADGKPIVHESGRVVKGPNYVPPALDQLFFIYGDTSGSKEGSAGAIP